MNEAMVRFNLVGGLVYTLTGEEAVKMFKEYAYSTTNVYVFNHDGKMIAINNDHIVSVEWKGPDYIEALEMASEALKRQIPMKPTPYIKTIGTCKSCEDSVHRLDNYCPNCGQKLDWSEE